MIKAYLTGIPNGFKFPVEARYSIFDDGKLILKKSVVLDYVEPELVGHASLDTLLRQLGKNSDKEIKIFINDGALYETVNGTSDTTDQDLLNMANETRKEMEKFDNLEIINVNGNDEQVAEWNKVLRPY
ncbi:hypothetical protein E9840_11705 [Tissierella creatinini]|nr:hypothetical protein E9840_11705 [Tissierella creatinini]TJX60845.1 hypothetical protein E8P77_19520 [Soehngenia saccharolytica]